MKHPDTRPDARIDTARQPAASNQDVSRDDEPQPQDAGTPTGANQGSPAAPVMKQTARTDSERGGRR